VTALVASRYNILVPLRAGRTLAFNGASGALAIWTEDETDVYSRVGVADGDSPDPVLRSLAYGGFILRDDIDEVKALRQRYDAVRDDSRQMILTIAPTMVCNFGCDYCFQGIDKPSGTMSADVQDAIVALVARTSDLKRLHVAWYGGEPLLAAGVIDSFSTRLISTASEMGLDYDAMIVTNGYRLTQAVARMLVTRRVRTAQVTLDGAAEDHDQRRHRLGGGGSFDRIIDNLQAVVAEVPELHISVRVNVDARNVDGLRALLALLVSRGFARRPHFDLYFAPVEAITEGCHSVSDSCLSKAEYARLETELMALAFDAGLSSLPYPPRMRGICGALRPNGFVVLPTGDVHKCWDTVAMPHLKVGTVFRPDELRSDARSSEWSQWSPFENAVCSACKILPNCAGSCAHKFINQTQTRGEAAVLPCPSWKDSINERLVLRAERTGVISSGDYDSAAIRTDRRELCPTEHEPGSIGTARRRLPLFDATSSF
jgi:uncharacterized protein